MTGAKKSVTDAIEALQAGHIIVIQGFLHGVEVGTLVRDAERAEADDINFMATHGRGLVSCAVHESALRRLDIPLIRSSHKMATAFCVSVDAKSGTTTGISASDRAITARLLADPASVPEDFARPGHLFPIQVPAGGVLAQPGLAEAAVEIAVLAGLRPAALTCPILSHLGDIADHEECTRFCGEKTLLSVTVDQVVEYVKERVAQTI